MIHIFRIIHQRANHSHCKLILTLSPVTCNVPFSPSMVGVMVGCIQAVTEAAIKGVK